MGIPFHRAFLVLTHSYIPIVICHSTLLLLVLIITPSCYLFPGGGGVCFGEQVGTDLLHLLPIIAIHCYCCCWCWYLFIVELVLTPKISPIPIVLFIVIWPHYLLSHWRWIIPSPFVIHCPSGDWYLICPLSHCWPHLCYSGQAFITITFIPSPFVIYQSISAFIYLTTLLLSSFPLPPHWSQHLTFLALYLFLVFIPLIVVICCHGGHGGGRWGPSWREQIGPAVRCSISCREPGWMGWVGRTTTLLLTSLAPHLPSLCCCPCCAVP